MLLVQSLVTTCTSTFKRLGGVSSSAKSKNSRERHVVQESEHTRWSPTDLGVHPSVVTF